VRQRAIRERTADDETRSLNARAEAFLSSDPAEPALSARASKRRHTGHKNTMRVFAGGARRGRASVFDELFDPDGLRAAYTTTVRARVGFWILARSSASYTCENHRRNTCVRKNVGDYAGPISRPTGRSVGRSARFCEPVLQNYDGRNSRARALLSAAKTLRCQATSYERPLRRVGGTISLTLLRQR